MNWCFVSGGAIGVLIGFAWTIFWTQILGFRNAQHVHLLCFTFGFMATGLIAVAVRRLPILVGLAAGALVMGIMAVIIGPRDGWIVVAVIVYGCSGAICGPLIGALIYLLPFVLPNVTSERNTTDQ